MRKRNPTILLTGFADDLATTAARLGSTTMDVRLVDQEATAEDVPEAADVVVYVLSRDSGYSSQLRGVFTYVHSRVQAPQKYLLILEEIHPQYGVFPELSHSPRISISELEDRLKRLESAT